MSCEKKIKELREKYENLQSEYDICKARLSIVEKKFLSGDDDKSIELKKKIVDLEETIDSLTKQLKKHMDENGKLKADIKEWREYKKETDEQIYRLNKDKNELKEITLTLYAMLDNLISNKDVTSTASQLISVSKFLIEKGYK